MHRASSAFLAGFRRLIDEKWLRMLSEGELQQAGERLGDVLSIWINVGKTSHVGMVDIPPIIYGNDWGMVQEIVRPILTHMIRSL